MRVLNLTVHNLTPSQLADGGVEAHPIFKEDVKKILNITVIPTREVLKDKAIEFADLAKKATEDYEEVGQTEFAVLIGSGTPSIQPMIVSELEKRNVKYVYSHSNRECVETHNPDGTVTKTFVFSHKGWY